MRFYNYRFTTKTRPYKGTTFQAYNPNIFSKTVTKYIRQELKGNSICTISFLLIEMYNKGILKSWY